MDDILIEVDDRGDADTILAALNMAVTKEYGMARTLTSMPSVAAYHTAEAQRFDRLARRFQDALDPEPEPPDEYEPPLPKDDPDFSGAELLTIRRQSQVPA